MSSGPTFIGLDGEMTGSERDEGHALIQIGLAAITADGRVDIFTSDIGQPDALIDPEASAVHGITRERIRSGPAPDTADQQAVRWLRTHGGDPDRRSKVVPVGWNVSGFDLPFVRDTLPDMYAMLSRRTVDLNAVVFTLAGRVYVGGGHPSAAGLKRMAKRHAQQQLAEQGHEPAWHNAGYDAAASILSWRWLCDTIDGTADAP